MAWEFLDGLAADNTSGYFNDHREQYRDCVAIPSAAFVEELTPALDERFMTCTANELTRYAPLLTWLTAAR